MTDNFKITSAAISDRGLSEKRPTNEDSYIELKRGRIFGVADGVGGAQAGDVASQMAMEILGEAFSNIPNGADAEVIMQNAIEKANSAIYKMSHELPQLSTMATTIVALHLSGNIATIGHVGDSRAYRLDSEGNLHRETQDHSVVEEEVRAGRMTPEQALNHPSKNIISRALGAEPDVEVDLKTLMFEPGASFLLCSDGITRHIKDAELKEFLSSGEQPTELCRRLRETCYERGAEDNLTAIVVNVSPEVDDGLAAVEITGEEETIASAREIDVRQTVSLEPEFDEMETQELPRIVEEEVKPEPEPAMAEPIAPSSLPPIVSTLPVIEDAPVFSGTKAYIDERKPGRISGILSHLALLLFGGLIGLGVYHFFLIPEPPPPPPPVIQGMESRNIPLTAFEENRRLVDKDPAGYVTKNAMTPQDAEDFYLLGRALLLNRKYPEARRAFTEARNRLADVDPNNAKTLEAEIAIALAVVNDPTVQSIFEKNLIGDNTNTNTNTNTNSNSNSNSNVELLR